MDHAKSKGSPLRLRDVRHERVQGEDEGRVAPGQGRRQGGQQDPLLGRDQKMGAQDDPDLRQDPRGQEDVEEQLPAKHVRPRPQVEREEHREQTILDQSEDVELGDLQWQCSSWTRS